MDDARPPGLRRAAEPHAPHRARGAADGRREAGHLPGLRPARPGTARTCSAVPYARAAGAAGRPRRSPGTAGWPRRGSAGGGADVQAASQENGLEGVVAKRLDSPYRPGRAQPRLAQDQELPHAGRRRRRLAAGAGPAGRRRSGSLLFGVPDDEGRLVYAGHVGTGFTDQDLRDLQRMFTAADDLAVPRRPAARGHPRRALGRARPGRRGRLRRVDGGRPAAAPVVAGRAGRPGARRRGGRAVSPAKQRVEIDGRTLSVSNLEKVLFPEVSFTKAQVIDYYVRDRAGAAAAPRRPPGDLHPLAGRRRGPDLLREEQRAARPRVGPAGHDPEPGQLDAAARRSTWSSSSRWPTWPGRPTSRRWSCTCRSGRSTTTACRSCPTCWCSTSTPARRPGSPSAAPSPSGSGERLEADGLDPVVKTSGSKGMQVYAPIESPPTASTPAGTPGRWRRSSPPRRPTTWSGGWRRCCGPGKVLIDWSQNNPAKTTVAPYSLRARAGGDGVHADRLGRGRRRPRGRRPGDAAVHAPTTSSPGSRSTATCSTSPTPAGRRCPRPDPSSAIMASDHVRADSVVPAP